MVSTVSATKLVVRQLYGCNASCKRNCLQQRDNLIIIRIFSSGKTYGAWLRDSASKLTSSLANSKKEAGEKAATNLPATEATSKLSSWRSSLSSQAKAQVEAGKDIVRQSAQTVQSKASQLAQRGQEQAAQSVQQASSQLKTKASQLAKNSQEKASQSISEVSSQVRTKASQLAQTSQQRASQSIHQTSSRLQTKASQLAQTSQAKASQSAQRASSQVKSVTSSITSELGGGFQSMGKKSLRWIWWWSLAAIAVYGMATTLPGQLLREYNHSRRLENSQRAESSKSTTITNQDDSSGGSSGYSSGYFTTTRASSKSDHNDAEELPSLDTGYSRWTSWLPTTGSDRNDLTDNSDKKTASRWTRWRSGGSEG